MVKLLLVEDDVNLSYIVQTAPEDLIGGYQVFTAANGAEGLKQWEAHKPDIIVSDIEMPVMNGFDMVMPVMNGFDMVRRIRETDKTTPIIFGSALTSPRDVKEGYKLGVNNYVKKPFVPDELDAHVHALLKLTEGHKTSDETDHYRLGRYTLDAPHAMLRDDQTGELQTLSQREAQLLQLLAENRNQTVRREAILSRLWGTEEKDYFASRSLDVFVNKLRKLLADEPQVEIKTVRGVGLMLHFKSLA